MALPGANIYLIFIITLSTYVGVSPTEPGTFVHTVRLFHTADGIKERAVYIENNFSFGDRYTATARSDSSFYESVP